TNLKKGAIHLGFRLRTKQIKERCGVVSFKKGETYYRNDKVSIEEWNDTVIKAVVQGLEDFHVHLKLIAGEVEATCTCPTLSSIQQDCQHVAAVLIALQKEIREVTIFQHKPSPRRTDEFLEIFQDSPIPKSREQGYFENRQ